MGEAENSQAKAYDLSGRQEADRGSAESKVGEIEEGSRKERLIAAFRISRA
jgi:hypothetical protein